MPRTPLRLKKAVSQYSARERGKRISSGVKRRELFLQGRLPAMAAKRCLSRKQLYKGSRRQASLRAIYLPRTLRSPAVEKEW